MNAMVAQNMALARAECSIEAGLVLYMLQIIDLVRLRAGET